MSSAPFTAPDIHPGRRQIVQKKLNIHKMLLSVLQLIVHVKTTESYRYNPRRPKMVLFTWIFKEMRSIQKVSHEV
jgi:hypothetical protein